MKPHVLKQMCQFCLIALCLVSLPSCAERKETTSISGYRHLDKTQSIVIFYVNDYSGGPIWSPNSGGGITCCAIIPTYKEGLKANVYWELHSPKEDEVRTYVADVPVEPYDIKHTGGLVVHFYDDAKVRVAVRGSIANPSLSEPNDDSNPLGNFPFPPEQLAQGRLVKIEKHVSEFNPEAILPDDEDTTSKDRIRTRRDCCWVTPEDKVKYDLKPQDP